MSEVTAIQFRRFSSRVVDFDTDLIAGFGNIQQFMIPFN
jgi:hypothetical protein